MTAVAFVGLGTMGRPMAGHLLRAGHAVHGYDVSGPVLEEFARMGGQPAGSPAQAAAAADVVFTMLPAPAQVSEVYEGPGGLFEVARPNQALVDCSTLGVPAVQQLHASARNRGCRFLDAPVTGAAVGAVKGTLVFIVGGDLATVREVEPLLTTMGSKCVYAGPGGSGQAIKICNNMAAGVIKMAICEAFVLADRLGVDPKLFFEVASQGSAQSFALNVLCPVPGIVESAPSSHDYQGGFATRLMHKDMMLACDAAELTGAQTPVTRLAAELFGRCSDSGYADLDNAVMYQFLGGRG